MAGDSCKRRAAALVALALTAGVTACSGNKDNGQAHSATDRATRAVYDDNYASVTNDFDAALKATVKRQSVGLISDKLHALGSYGGLTYVSMDENKHEYTYRANFSKGSQPVVVRLDADGKLAAYRIFLPRQP